MQLYETVCTGESGHRHPVPSRIVTLNSLEESTRNVMKNDLALLKFLTGVENLLALNDSIYLATPLTGVLLYSAGVVVRLW